MQLDYPANKQGVRYAYYICSGRASKRKKCTRRAVPVGIAEQLVADCYRDITITEEQYAALAAQVEAAFDERLAARSQERAELTVNRKRLQNESDKLLAAHFAEAIDLETRQASPRSHPRRTGRHRPPACQRARSPQGLTQATEHRAEPGGRLRHPLRTDRRARQAAGEPSLH